MNSSRQGRITLEDFGSPAMVADAAAAVAEPALQAEDQPVAVLQMADPDPQAERNRHFARIAGALETIASERAALRTRCLRDAADALGSAAASLLPAIARAGFPALVAEAVGRFAGRGQWPELAVSLAPDDAEDVAAFLAAGSSPVLNAEFETAGAIRIDPRDDISVGEAVLRWDGGGAEIDVAAITDAVLTEFRRKLDLLTQSGT